MWIVQLALNRMYTMAVLAILIIFLGCIALTKMPVDIFPTINIPVISVVWTYSGFTPEDMEKRIISVVERSITTTTNDIQRLESTSVRGMGIIKVYMHPGANLPQALSTVTAVCQAQLRQLPPGVTPPLITSFSATDVPVLQLGLRSKVASESELFDLGANFVRTQLATIQGATIPWPYGGMQRQVMVDLNVPALQSRHMSPNDVTNAVNSQNLILPSGNAKIGSLDYDVAFNASPSVVSEMNDFPIKHTDSASVFLRDVASAHDGFAVQTNVVNFDGRRSVILNVLKNGGVSTLDVANRIKAALPRVGTLLPEYVNIDILIDQSKFVTDAVNDVLREGLTAAGLTAILMFILLKSWRTTLIVATSIPLSAMVSIIGLSIAHQTINTMTLGGLALAVGMLVDDATVEVENIHRNLSLGTPIRQSILHGAQEIAKPALVATLAICIVFIPVFNLSEPAKSLFAPLSMSVIFAMLASYFLSRTVVPTMALMLLKNEHHGPPAGGEARLNGGQDAKGTVFARAPHATDKNVLAVVINRFLDFVDERFDAVRHSYRDALHAALTHRKAMIGAFACVVVFFLSLIPFAGFEYFPTSETNAVRLHVSAPPGTRIEETDKIVQQVENLVRGVFPPHYVEGITDNQGLTVSSLNMSYGDGSNFTEADGEIFVKLSEKIDRAKLSDYRDEIRRVVAQQMPGIGIFFQSPDIVSQVLNAGLPATIDVQISGQKVVQNYAIAKKMIGEIKAIDGARDVHISQSFDSPVLSIDVDRSKAEELGLSERDVVNSLLVSLSSSFQTAPAFWLNPDNGVSYSLAVQTPPRAITSVEDVRMTPITAGTANQLLTNLASIRRTSSLTFATHLNVQPTIDVQLNIEKRDLGFVYGKVKDIVARYSKQLPRGSYLDVRGQGAQMESALQNMAVGLVLAIILVYLLLVVNFQSWIDPLIILMAVPPCLAGITWMLLLTHSAFSVPAVMGSIMAVGVACANSILVVNFANQYFHEGETPLHAALQAGFSRFRPVVMTAAAMIIGMLPMSLGLGGASSQNVPLGRAVIGGLLFATISTLFLVPICFSLLKLRKGSIEDVN
jgi:multidrug efflux pump subunit AcrB